jgi:pimeloyl-ACP methyl ester carboxylesterase
MALLHETGLIGAPVPVYFETIEPERPSGRPTVLMIHGGAHTGACYQRTADGRRGWAYVFAERGYRTVVPDWPGTGRSGYVPLAALTGATVVEGLGALARSLGGPLVLLTHSMSGAYGWRLAELNRGLIHAVVGVAPAPPGNIQKAAPVYAETETTIETEASGRRVSIDKTRPIVPTRDFVERKLIGESRFFPRERLAEYAASLRPIPPRLLLERQNVHGGNCAWPIRESSRASASW